MDCTAPPTLHYTALHLVKFEILFFIRIYITLLLCFYTKKSRKRETPNISNNANRSTNTKTKQIKQGFFLLFWGIWLSGVELLCTGLYLNPMNYTALFFNLQCTSLKSKKKYIYTFNAQQLNSLEGIELHCLANC